MSDYTEQRNDGYYVKGTRVSLDSVVHAFRRGAAPESIFRSFPAVGSLERVYGAITFYLANQVEVDAYLDKQQAIWNDARSKQDLPPELKERLSQARQQISGS